MAQYNYFWDLENSQAYTNHTVKQLDANATTGGGSFKWVAVANNATIQNIPGIRIKPLNNIKGYWERDSEGPWLVDWFGCVNTAGQSTLTGYGLIAGDLTARFNCVTKDINGNTVTPSNTITLTDTYDTAAMKLAFNLMELGYTSSIQFKNKIYYITSTCYLPLDLLIFNKNTNPFIIEGNGAEIKNRFNGTSFTYWDRNILNQTVADAQITSRFFISNLNFRHTSALYNIGLHLKCSSNSKLTNLSFNALDHGLYLSYVVNSEISNIDSIGCITSSLRIDTGAGFWTGATNSNSQCNYCTINTVRCRLNGNTAPLGTSIWLRGATGIILNNIYLAGTPTSNTAYYGIYFDSLGLSGISSFKINNLQLDVNSLTFPPAGGFGTWGIVLTPYNTNIEIDDINNTTAIILIQVSNAYAGVNNITVRNSGYIEPTTLLYNSNDTVPTNGGNQWLFENCRTLNPLTAGRWYALSQPVTGAWTADGPGTGATVRLRESYPFRNRS